VFLTGSPALAQAPPPVPDSVRVLEGITIRVPRPALTTGGASAVVLDVDSARHVPAPSLEDVLRAMPLIQIRRNSRGEAQPALRGAEDRQIAILVDGVPLTLGWDHRTDMSVVAVGAARSVTLVRGLSSVLYGPNTLGGVVSVDVARAQQREESVDPLVLGAALDHTGGVNVSASAGRLVDRGDGQWVFRGGIGFNDRPGVPVASDVGSEAGVRERFLSDGDLRLNSDERRRDAFFLARHRTGGGAWTSLSASAYDVDRGVPPEVHLDEPRLWRYPDQQRLVAALTAGTGQRDIGLGMGDVEANFGVDLGTTRIEEFDDESYRTVAASEDGDDKVLTFRLLADHTLGSRGDLRASATYGDVFHKEVLTPGATSEYRQRLWSVGVETEWRLDAAARTRVALGGALDGADTPESGDKPPLGSLVDHGLRVGVTSLLSPSLSVHGGVSRRSRFPSLRELYSGALGRFEPNPELRAETLLGVEGGLTWGAAQHVQVVAFHHRLRDGIVRISVRGADGVSRFKRINQSVIKSSGIELLAARAIGDVVASGDLTLQRTKGEDDARSEVELEYEPEVMGRVGAEVLLPAQLVAGGDVRFVGRQRCANAETGTLQDLASSRSLDVSARRGLTTGFGALRRLELSASLHNALGSTVFDQCGLPQPGRTLTLQMKLW
jgi:iron complex outermembrane receptor protein